MSLSVLNEKSMPMKVGFFLGSVKIISKDVVRHANKIEDQYTAGIKSIDIDFESAGYLN